MYIPSDKLCFDECDEVREALARNTQTSMKALRILSDERIMAIR